LSEKDFNCRTCDDVLKRERGCETEGVVPFYIDGERYFRCPLKLITPLSYEYISAFRFYDKGMLPQGKGWAHEAKKYLEAMAVVDNAVNDIEIRQAKKTRSRQQPNQ